MCLPDISCQHSPRPDAIWVTFPTACPALIAPQLKHERSQVDNWLVHNITWEACWRCENALEAIENSGLPDPSFEPSLSVDCLARRFQDIVEIISIFCCVNPGKVSNVNVRVVASVVVYTIRAKQGWIIVRSVELISPNQLAE